MIHGRNLIIKKNGVAVASAKSCSISMKSDTTETSCPTNGRDRTYITGRYEWSVSVSVFVFNINNTLLQVGDTFTLSFEVVGSNESMTGSAITEKADISASRGNIAQGTFDFKGVGKLEEVEE